MGQNILEIILGGDRDTDEPLCEFSKTELLDGRYSFKNPRFTGAGYYLKANYAGTERININISLSLGEVVGVSEGKAWKTCATSTPTIYPIRGIVMGWDADALYVQIEGIIISEESQGWKAGTPLYVSRHGGLPTDQCPILVNSHYNRIGITLSDRSFLLGG